MEPEENWDDYLPSVQNYVWLGGDEPELQNSALFSEKTTYEIDENVLRSSDDIPDSSTLSVGKFHCQRKPRPKYTLMCVDRKISVTNINYRTTQKVLWSFFGKFGVVKNCSLIPYRHGRSSGRAFVVFADENGASAALDASRDELYCHGRILMVRPFQKKVFESVKSNNEGEIQNEVVPSHESGDDGKDQVSSSTSNEDELSITNNPPIFLLNDDEIAKIMEYLTIEERLQSERVCKRWRAVSLQHWSRLKRLKPHSGFRSSRCFTDKDLKNLLQRGSASLASLDLSCASASVLTDQSLRTMAKHSKNLKELDVSGMNISNNGLKALAESCQQLESIKFSERCQRIGEKGLWWLFHLCKNLRQIDLKGNRLLKGQCFHVLCRNVLDLNLSGCSELKDIGIQKVYERSPGLKILSVANCGNLTDSAIKIIGQFSELTSLDISGIYCTMPSSAMLELRHLKHLQHLNASVTHSVDDLVLIAISQHCHQLRSLIVSDDWGSTGYITDNAVKSIASNCPLLKVLIIGFHLGITDSSLKALSQLQSLTDLNVSGSGVTDEGVKSVLSGCPVLQLLNLNRCANVTGASIYAAVSRMQKYPEQTLNLMVGDTSFDTSKIPEDLTNLTISCSSYAADDCYDFSFDDDDDELNCRFSQFSIGLGEYDEYLDNDDPLEQERWDFV